MSLESDRRELERMREILSLRSRSEFINMAAPLFLLAMEAKQLELQIVKAEQLVGTDLRAEYV